MKYERLLLLMLTCLTTGTNAEETIPVDGIGHVAFEVVDLEKSQAFYTKHYGFLFAFSVDEGPEARYLKINDDQFLKLVGKPEGTDDDRLVEVAFEVSDLEATVTLLRARGLNPGPVRRRADGTLASVLSDPEGHRLVFVEYVDGSEQVLARGKHLGANRVSERLWHVGLTISDEAVANAFYRDKLGFEEVWRASRTDGGPDAWVNMQIPGERGDYIEYILLNGTTPDRQRLGTMHHVCYMIDDIGEAHAHLLCNGLADLKKYEPRIGRNQRWLLNVHDPDGTRSELMENRLAD
ncbi:MAG: VOC family protein [Puniceicoccaceae bacterium]